MTTPFQNDQSDDVYNGIINYILVYLLIAVSSIPFFFGNLHLIIGFFISFYFFILKRKNFDKSIFIYSGIFLFIFLCQVYLYHELIFSVFLAFFIRIFFAYFVLKVVGKNFINLYVNILVFFSIISLIFWILIITLPSFESYLYSTITPFFDKITYFPAPTRQHFIIYTMPSDAQQISLYLTQRNSGPFWECGGFGIFLIIALIFNYLINRKIFNRINLILFLTILSTQSTGTFITLGVLIFFYLISNQKIIYSFIIFPAFFVLFIYSFNKFDFLGKKIEKDIEYVNSSKNDPNASRTRGMSAYINYTTFLDSPIVGRGRFYIVDKDDATSNNGLGLFLAEFGIFGFLAYFGTMLTSFLKYCKYKNYKLYNAYAIVIIIMVAGLTQGIYTKPLFLGISFLFTFNHFTKHNINAD